LFRSLPVAVLEIMIVAAVLHVMRAGCLRRTVWRFAKADFHLTVLGVAPLIYLLVLPLAAPLCYALPGIIVAGLLLTLAVALDLAARRYFDQGVFEIVAHLPVGPGFLLHPKIVAAYLRQYVPSYYYLPVPGAAVLAWIILRGAGPPRAGTALIAACLFECAVIINGRKRPAAPAALSDVEKAILELGEAAPPQPLYTSSRMHNIVVQAAPLYRPRTILLIINESAGRHLPASSGAGSLADRIRALSGDADSWLVPANVVTNSPCTDVSLPSILTGCGAHESVDTLHALPFVFDLAKSVGYTTQFYTSSVMDWANFSGFFQGAALDTLFSAETTGLPYINDLAVDDMLPVRAWTVFSVLYNNALHLPFQAESLLNFPPGCERRRDRALFIVEATHKEIFDALKATGRYDDALIFSIGDHGEVDQQDALTQGSPSRLIKFSKEVLHPLFMIKPPAALPPELKGALFANKNALIANADIAPTLAALFGLRCEGRDYTGRSLWSKIPADRFSLVLTANAWRSWPRNAAAIVRGETQLIVDHTNDQLCRISGRKADKNELLEKALHYPVLGTAIGQTFAQKLINRHSDAQTSGSLLKKKNQKTFAP
jgi:hypothetical protein